MTNKKFEKIQAEYDGVFSLMQFKEEKLDYSIIQKHIDYLTQIDENCNSIFLIFDLFKKKHLFISKNISKTLHLDYISANEDDKYLDIRTHPEDLLMLYETGVYFLKYAISLPLESKKNAKLVNEYRILNGQGEYVKIVEQQSCLEMDKSGNVWLALGIIDISLNQEKNFRFQSRLITMGTNEVFTFPPKTNKDILTLRETEILGLIAKGLISKQIADKLFISVNTVNTHRQRIIEKLNTGNIIEAINYASSKGII